MADAQDAGQRELCRAIALHEAAHIVAARAGSLELLFPIVFQHQRVEVAFETFDHGPAAFDRLEAAVRFAQCGYPTGHN